MCLLLHVGPSVGNYLNRTLLVGSRTLLQVENAASLGDSHTVFRSRERDTDEYGKYSGNKQRQTGAKGTQAPKDYTSSSVTIHVQGATSQLLAASSGRRREFGGWVSLYKHKPLCCFHIPQGPAMFLFVRPLAGRN